MHHALNKERPPRNFYWQENNLFLDDMEIFRFTVCMYCSNGALVVKLKIATLDQKHGKNSDGS